MFLIGGRFQNIQSSVRPFLLQQAVAREREREGEVAEISIQLELLLREKGQVTTNHVRETDKGPSKPASAHVSLEHDSHEQRRKCGLVGGTRKERGSPWEVQKHKTRKGGEENRGLLAQSLPTPVVNLPVCLCVAHPISSSGPPSLPGLDQWGERKKIYSNILREGGGTKGAL